VALRIARRCGAEVVSVDSMQVYRGMDVGTAKPSPAEQDEVPHHLIDLADPEEAFTVAEFQRAGRAVLDDLERRGVPALLVGGSGLHFRSLVDPLQFEPSDREIRAGMEALGADEAVEALLAADPGAGDVVDLANPRRVVRALEVLHLTGRTPTERAALPEAAALRDYRPVRPLIAVGLDPGARLPQRVEARFDRMLAGGLLDEVAALAPRLGPTAAAAVGYRQLLPVVAGKRGLDYGRLRAVQATRALARRQRTFFRRDPRIVWPEWDDDPGSAASRIAALLEEAGWIS